MPLTINKKKYDNLNGREASVLDIYNAVMNGTVQYQDQDGYEPLM